MSRVRQALIPSHFTPSALRGANSGLAVSSLTGEAMGTSWKLVFQEPPSNGSGDIRRVVERAFGLVICQMSHWDPDSELCQFNRAPAKSWHPLSPEFFEVLSCAIEIARASGGACDPTLGEIVDLHGFGPLPPTNQAPTEEQLSAARNRAGWTRLRLDHGNRSAFQPGGCRLDLSSIAKGYAVDLAARGLLDHGLLDFTLELGGEVRGHGCKPDGQPWWIAIDSPSDIPETVVALCEISLATSGDSMRRRVVGEREISHLVDPTTGHPSATSITSVSVVALSCMEADAWATALMVAGPELGLQLAESRNLAAIFTCRTSHGHHQRFSSEAQRMLD